MTNGRRHIMLKQHLSIQCNTFPDFSSTFLRKNKNMMPYYIFMARLPFERYAYILALRFFEETCAPVVNLQQQSCCRHVIKTKHKL